MRPACAGTWPGAGKRHPQWSPRTTAGGGLVNAPRCHTLPNLTRACRPYGVIENVVTDLAHRGQGWGRAVLSHALSEAWRLNCYKVMLPTGRKDEATLRFYEHVGFDRQGKQALAAKPPAWPVSPPER
ncbi:MULTISPECIES: N-acetyltransferase [unclassified Acidovorax]|uniref:GNAT family N-acetyltransferase n=1 Tax=unclassified Acidovorax TaxID=2684926 RepID=UPI001C48B950|nr:MULTISPECIES: GNAT family N-acetyltransferase [unclassified Acidovorax]MBV7431332.1 GNAT family N-acetyltransferase [Acidovorax sp. sif0732]MBV7452438.1 GNAT family N-acetyltransferase [Acidovorax sp. sif0715]